MPFFIKLLLAHTYIIFNLNNSCNSLPGPSLIQRFRPDLKAKFAHLFDDNTMLDYIYHCNAQTPRYIVTVNFKVNVIKDDYKNTNFVPVLKLLLFSWICSSMKVKYFYCVLFFFCTRENKFAFSIKNYTDF